jgi:hypothetical protein
MKAGIFPQTIYQWCYNKNENYIRFPGEITM